MTYFGTSDLPVLLADFGVPVVWGSVTDKGLKDEADEEMMSGAGVDFAAGLVVVTLETLKFAGIKEGDSITVDGQSRHVVAVRRFGDGALSRVFVRT